MKTTFIALLVCVLLGAQSNDAAFLRVKDHEGSPQTATQSQGSGSRWSKLCVYAHEGNLPKSGAGSAEPEGSKTGKVKTCLTYSDVGSIGAFTPFVEIGILQVGSGKRLKIVAIQDAESIRNRSLTININRKILRRLDLVTCSSIGPNCLFEAVLEAEDAAQLKSGTDLIYTNVDALGYNVEFVAPLSGFVTSFDGPAIEEGKYNDEQRLFVQMLLALLSSK